jgi:hypothetical protein
VGVEYQLHFNAPDCESVATQLRRRFSGAIEPSPGRFEFEVDDSPGWPSATLVIEPTGAYFCDHCGGSGRAMLGQVIALFTSSFGAVTVMEL